MRIRVFDKQKSLKIDKSSARALVKALLSYLKSSPEEISLYFVTTEEISDLHAEFFNDPTTTDCISFPIDAVHLGDVFVCPKTAIDYAKKKGLDPYQETALYIVHAILHLLGYDDLKPSAKDKMRKKEKLCMRQLDELQIYLKPK